MTKDFDPHFDEREDWDDPNHVPFPELVLIWIVLAWRGVTGKH